jgi:hypothetical protein
MASHYFSDCSLDQGTFRKVKWQLGSKCPSSYSILTTSIATRILTTTSESHSSYSLIPRQSAQPLSTIRLHIPCKHLPFKVHLFHEPPITTPQTISLQLPIQPKLKLPHQLRHQLTHLQQTDVFPNARTTPHPKCKYVFLHLCPSPLLLEFKLAFRTLMIRV